MPKTISIKVAELTQLTGQDATDFFAFLMAQKEQNVSYFKAGNYPMSKDKTLSFEQDFLCEDAVDGVFTGDFVGGKIGSGGFATVYHIDKVVQVTKVGFLPSGYTQPQALKIQHNSDDYGLQLVRKEFNISRKTPHLHPRTPVIEDASHTSYSPMEELPGCELFDLIADDLSDTTRLSLQQRMDLSVGVLDAVLAQVKQCGLIHRDLKPENIRVELGAPITVNIIDFGFSIELPLGQLGIMNSSRGGSHSYIAPEVIMTTGSYNQSAAQDVFSVARILQLIWGGFDETYLSREERGYRSHVKEKYLHLSLFFRLPKAQWAELDSLCLSDRIVRIHKQMLAFKPDDRMSIEDALQEFKELQALLLPSPHSSSLPQVVVSAKSTAKSAGGDPRFFATSPGKTATSTPTKGAAGEASAARVQDAVASQLSAPPVKQTNNASWC